MPCLRYRPALESLSLAEPLKLIVGGRFSNYEIDDVVGGSSLHYKKSSEFTPYAGLVYDIDKTHSAYVSYTGIFNPQTDYRDSKGNVLTPSKGKPRKIKGAYMDGRLNASVALFHTELDNAAQMVAGTYTPGGAQAYIGADGTKSRGIELDLQGELARGWNIYAGYRPFHCARWQWRPLEFTNTAHHGPALQHLPIARRVEQVDARRRRHRQSRFYQAPNTGTQKFAGRGTGFICPGINLGATPSRRRSPRQSTSTTCSIRSTLQKGDFDTVGYVAHRAT